MSALRVAAAGDRVESLDDPLRSVRATPYEALRRDAVATLALARRVRDADAAARRAVGAEVGWWAVDEARAPLLSSSPPCRRTCPRCELLTVRPVGLCGVCLAESTRRGKNPGVNSLKVDGVSAYGAAQMRPKPGGVPGPLEDG